MIVQYVASVVGSESYTPTMLEWRHAVSVADWMRDEAVSRGSSAAHGMSVGDDRAREDQRRGEIGALVAAAVIGIYYPAWVDKYDHPDLPHNIEVRAVSMDHYGMRVRPSDTGSRRGVLVVVPSTDAPCLCRVVGWVRSLEYAKRPEWMIVGDPRRPPMYAVPQSDMEPVYRLRVLCASERWFESPPPPG